MTSRNPSAPDHDLATAHLPGDLLRAASAAMPQVLAGQVPGYDALRLLRALELGRELSQRLAERGRAPTALAWNRNVASATRRKALRALKTIAGFDAFVEVHHAWQQGSIDERARLLEKLADDLASITAGVPADVAAAVGVTPELLSGLRQEARAMHHAGSDRAEHRESLAHVIDALAGAIRHELDALAVARAKPRPKLAA